MTEQKIIDVKWENEQVVLLDIDDLFGEIPLPKLIAKIMIEQQNKKNYLKITSENSLQMYLSTLRLHLKTSNHDW